MSYNPNTMNPNGRPTRQRRYDKNAGKRHSSIISREGPRGIDLLSVKHREPTTRGWKVDQFRGDTFEVVYEYVCSGNATGKLVHDELDRCIRVLSGVIHIIIDNETLDITNGQAVSLVKGTEYEICTSGSLDAEIILIQGPGYENTVTQITEPEATNSIMTAAIPAEHTYPKRTSGDKARLAAQQMEDKRRSREKRKRAILAGKSPGNVDANSPPPPPSHKEAPLANQQVEGFSPMPVGAGGYKE